MAQQLSCWIAVKPDGLSLTLKVCMRQRTKSLSLSSDDHVYAKAPTLAHTQTSVHVK